MVFRSKIGLSRPSSVDPLHAYASTLTMTTRWHAATLKHPRTYARRSDPACIHRDRLLRRPLAASCASPSSGNGVASGRSRIPRGHSLACAHGLLLSCPRRSTDPIMEACTRACRCLHVVHPLGDPVKIVWYTVYVLFLRSSSGCRCVVPSDRSIVALCFFSGCIDPRAAAASSFRAVVPRPAVYRRPDAVRSRPFSWLHRPSRCRCVALSGCSERDTRSMPPSRGSPHGCTDAHASAASPFRAIVPRPAVNRRPRPSPRLHRPSRCCCVAPLGCSERGTRSLQPP